MKSKDWCAAQFCNQVVAPHDPERKVHNGLVYHGHCWKKVSWKLLRKGKPNGKYTEG